MLFARLWSWWRRWRAPLGHLEVVMYTRRGCHLCEAAWAQLRRQRRRYGFRLAAVDVDADPELRRRHGDCVPVVAVGGRVRFRGAVNPVLLARLLRAEVTRLNDRAV
jgi:glutaredoxin